MRLTSLVLLLLTACTADLPTDLPTDTGEAAGERDLPRSRDTGRPDDTGQPDDTGTPWLETDPDPVGEACYLGGDRSGGFCVPVVPWSDAWGDDYRYPEPLHDSPQYAAPARFVDLSTTEADGLLAPNFQLGELMSEWKGRFGVSQPHLVDTLQGMRDQTGGAMTVNSAYRNVSYNAGVGGATWSRHMYGDAVDITSAVLDLEGLGELCEEWGADYVSLYESHVHCDWRDEPLDPAFYGSAFHGSASYDQGDATPTPRPVLSGQARQIDGVWTVAAQGFDEGEPLRVWQARAADGRLLAAATGRRFRAPPGTTHLQVAIGGQLVHEIHR